MSENINWDEMLSGNFVKLVNGTPKKMKLSGWKLQDKFKDEKTGELRPGVTFTVTEEDGKVFEGESVKEWTVTAIKALAKLRPLIEEVDKAGKKEIVISVVRVGEGRKTEYDIKRIE